MKRTIVATLSVVLALAGLAGAVTLDTKGTGTATPVPTPIIMDTVCVEWILIGADVDYTTDDGIDKYTWLGNCNVNVDTTGHNPNMVNLPFKLEGEWFHKMKRASEKVTVISAQYGVSFHTWATCNTDPFPKDNNASCSNPGMGSNKWSLYINQSQAPFGKGKTTKAAAIAKSPKKILQINPRAVLTSNPPPPPRPTATSGSNANQLPPTILQPTQNAVLSGGAPMTIKLQAAPGSNVTLYDVEGQKKVGGVWQAWFNITYNMTANPNGVSQQTGTQNPERRLRARSQGVGGAQWSGWVNLTLQ